MEENIKKSPRLKKYYDKEVPVMIKTLLRIAEALEGQNKLEEKRQLFEKKKWHNEKILLEGKNLNENQDG